MQVQNPSLGGNQQALQVSTVHLAQADILALVGTPFTLVPAPGAGNVIAVQSIAMAYHFGTKQYFAYGNDSLIVQYGSGPTAIGSAGDFGSLIGNNQSAFLNQLGPVATVNILPGINNQAVTLSAAFTYQAGPIVSSTLGGAGAGYAANDTGTLQDGNFDATYKVLTVGAGGAVLTYLITGPGTGYAVVNGVATATGGAQPGAGTGLTINVTAITPGDGTLKVTTYYQIISVP